MFNKFLKIFNVLLFTTICATNFMIYNFLKKEAEKPKYAIVTYPEVDFYGNTNWKIKKVNIDLGW